jgi:hypothetical protein
MATVTITDVTDDPYSIFGSRCLPEVRWAGPGLLEQKWIVIEYRHGCEYAHREEWREVPTVSNGE